MHTKPHTPPRLVIAWIDSDGDVSEVIGDFADGPRGRPDAWQAETRETASAAASREQAAHSALSLVDHVPDPDAYNPCESLRIERVFTDGRQTLLRLPSRDDERPATLGEAQAQEARRVAAIGRGESFDALTPAERSAEVAHTVQLRAQRDEALGLLQQATAALASQQAPQVKPAPGRRRVVP